MVDFEQWGKDMNIVYYTFENFAGSPFYPLGVVKLLSYSKYRPSVYPSVCKKWNDHCE